MPTLVKPTRTFSDQLLSRSRLLGDAPADAVVSAVVETDGPAGLRALMSWLADTRDFSMDQQPATVQAFFMDYAHLPTWADPKRMARGMAFFQKHAGPIGLTLGTYSLPYTYLGANGVRLLWLTERIKNDTARRLQETGEWVFAVNNPKEWLTAPAAGTVNEGRVRAVDKTLKVRLIHAAARWFGLHSGRWDMAWGMPVNQEDMVGTIGSFSYIVIRGLRKAGIRTTEQEEEDYMHHINVVGYINGVAEELLPQNLREAYHLDQRIAKRQFMASEAGSGLTRSLLNAIAEVGGTSSDRPEAIRNLAAGEMRFFLGDDYADMLDIPKASVEKRLAGLINRLPIFPSLIPAARSPD